MTDKRQEQEHAPSAPGGTTGRPVQPTPSTEPARPEEAGAVREIPIGMPMSPEEFRRRKERAEEPTLDDARATADEDAPPEED